MTILFSGLAVFFGIHAVPLFPAFKASLESRLGAMRFKGVYSLIAAVGFGLILLGMARAEFRPVYVPVRQGAVIANFAMPISFCLLVAAYVPNNFRRIIRHPMLTGVALWAFTHLLANGDLASLALFGSFGLYAIVDMIAVNRRTAAPAHPRQSLAMDAIVVAAGFAAFWVVRYFHASLFGMPAVY